MNTLHVEIGYQYHSKTWIVTPFKGREILEYPVYCKSRQNALAIARDFEVKYSMATGDYQEQLQYTWVSPNKRISIAHL